MQIHIYLQVGKMLVDFTCSCLPLNHTHQFYKIDWPARVRDLSVSISLLTPVLGLQLNILPRALYLNASHRTQVLMFV